MAKYIGTEFVPTDLIDLAPNHPRKTFEGIEKIGQSIKEKGQMQPICVRPKNERFELAFGARRLKGCQLKGIPEVRVEIWDMDDSELEFWQLREIYHTVSLKADAEADEAYRNKFHREVEKKLQVCKLQACEYCPQCYNCPKHPRHQVTGCPAFISLEKFAGMIGSEIDPSNIFRAFSRANIREEIPEINNYDLPSPSLTLPMLHSLYKHNSSKNDVSALAKKTAEGKLGKPTAQQETSHKTGRPDKLRIIIGYLRGTTLINGQEATPEVKRKLISEPFYGPLSAESEMTTGRSLIKEEIVKGVIDISSVSTDVLRSELRKREPEVSESIRKQVEPTPTELTGKAVIVMLDLQKVMDDIKSFDFDAMPLRAKQAIWLKVQEVTIILQGFISKYSEEFKALPIGGNK